MRPIARALAAAALGVAAAGAAACGGPDPTHAVLVVKDFGEIRIELLPEAAPRTVEHFTGLAADGVYDGTLFHRVIPGFMIQGGDPLSKDDDPRNDGSGGSGHPVPDEFGGGISHERGVVSLANRGYPNSGDAQFFIVVKDAPWLDGKYAAFGRVVSGMDVVDAIAAVERKGERPVEDVVIETVRLESAPRDAAAPAGAPAEGAGGASPAGRAADPATPAPPGPLGRRLGPPAARG